MIIRASTRLFEVSQVIVVVFEGSSQLGDQVQGSLEPGGRERWRGKERDGKGGRGERMREETGRQ